MTGLTALDSLTDDREAFAALESAYALHAAHVETEEQLAAIAGLPVEVVKRYMEDQHSLAKLEAAATKAEVEGKTLAPTARRVRMKLLRAVEATVDKGVDGFEAVELDKLTDRIIAQDEKAKAADKDPYAHLPVINVQIIHGHITAELTKPVTRADVVDVEPKEGAA